MNYKDILEYIKKSNRILLINHVKMDGDALGSIGAMYFVLEKLGKNIRAINEMPPQENFSFLEANEIFENDLDLKEFKPDLIISLDSGNIEQLGDVYKNNKEVFDITPLLVIDHHPSNTLYGSLNIVEPNISSTCELLFIILNEIGLYKYIDTKEANLLLTGIITDTNIFYNKNTTPYTLEVVSKLLEKGANMREIIYNFYNKISLEKTKLKGLMFNKIQKTKDGKIIWAKITEKDFKKTGTNQNDTSGLIIDLLNIDGCEIAMLLYETEKGLVKVSFRSNNYNVGELATSFPGGGGHKLASGFTSNKNLEKTEKEIFKKIKL